MGTANSKRIYSGGPEYKKKVKMGKKTKKVKKVKKAKRVKKQQLRHQQKMN